MAEGTLVSKSRRVFGLDVAQVEGDGLPDGSALVFNYDRDEDDGFVDAVLLVFVDDWRDFGSPKSLTVTIEPGDLLNG